MFAKHRLLQTKVILPVLFFIAVFITGLNIYDDYGITWDDPAQRSIGLATFDYVTGKKDSLVVNIDPLLVNHYYNPFIELVAIIPEKIENSPSLRAPFLSKHLVNFIFSWVGLIFFYLLALEMFRDYRWAFIAIVLFILTPRIVAHSFFNSKDIPVLYLFVISTYCLIKWLRRRNFIWMILLGLTAGLLTGARIIGLMMPLLVIIISLFLLIAHQLNKRQALTLFSFFLIYPFAVYLFLPSIWGAHPFTEMKKAIEIMSHFPFEAATLFMGKSLSSKSTPWYFVPVWIAVTFPIGWCLFFIVGFIIDIRSILIRPFKNIPIHNLILLLWILIPAGSWIILKPNLYDDGRHFYFIYPAMLLIATHGLKFLLTRKLLNNTLNLTLKAAIFSLLISTTIYLSYFMVRFHPFQYTYFNLIGRQYANENFEKDYWGLSYRNALEYLVRYDSNPEIKLCWTMEPCESNLVWLNTEDRNRIRWTKFRDCDYFVTIFKSHPVFTVPGKKIYEVNVQGNTIVALYKMNPPNNFDLPIY